MNSVLLSIIVPVYNVEKYIGQCIDSIAKQMNEYIELIIINDGSTDHSDSVIREKLLHYQQKSITYQIYENAGVTVARNRGLSIAKGKYIWYVDSDDYIVEDALNRLMPAIQSNSVDIIHFHLSYQFENKNIQKQTYDIQQFFSGSIAYKEFLMSYDFNLYTKLYLKSFLEKVDLHIPERLYYEDLFAIIYIMRASTFLYIDEVFYIYRLREGSIIHQKESRKQLDIINIVEKLQELVKQDEFYIVFRPFIHLRCLYSLEYVAKLCQNSANSLLIENYIKKNYLNEINQENLFLDYLFENLV